MKRKTLALMFHSIFFWSVKSQYTKNCKNIVFSIYLGEYYPHSYVQCGFAYAHVFQMSAVTQI